MLQPPEFGSILPRRVVNPYLVRSLESKLKGYEKKQPTPEYDGNLVKAIMPQLRAALLGLDSNKYSELLKERNDLLGKQSQSNWTNENHRRFVELTGILEGPPKISLELSRRQSTAGDVDPETKKRNPELTQQERAAIEEQTYFRDLWKRIKNYG